MHLPLQGRVHRRGGASAIRLDVQSSEGWALTAASLTNREEGDRQMIDQAAIEKLATELVQQWAEEGHDLGEQLTLSQILQRSIMDAAIARHEAS